MTDFEKKVVNQMAQARRGRDMSEENFNKGREGKQGEVSMLSLEEAILKEAKERRKRVLTILKSDLELKTIKVSFDCILPQLGYDEPFEQDILGLIADEFYNSKKFFPIIIDSYGRILIGHTFYYVAEMLNLKKITVIKDICFLKSDMNTYWDMLFKFASELSCAKWNFLRMMLNEFKEVGI